MNLTYVNKYKMGNCFTQKKIDIVKIAKVNPKIGGRTESFEKIQIRCSENHNKYEF